MHAVLPPNATFDPETLANPEEAVARYLAAFPLAPVGVEEVTLANASGRILARDAVAAVPSPADPRSTMDGFAVRAADGMSTRRIVGEIRMGRPPDGPLRAGEAKRIPPGGVLPPGADAVVPLEDADVSGARLDVREPVERGAYFTPRGDDIQAGEVVLPAGRRIGGPELAVLATLGIVEIAVYRQPRVALISTGDELVAAGATPATGQVRDSNRWGLAGTLVALGCVPVHIDVAVDTPHAMRARLSEGLRTADAVLLSGGSSVGAHDLTPDIIGSFDGSDVLIHGIKVKPGKPTVFARIGKSPVLELPGNPASSLMILEAVMKPILIAMTGELRARRARIATVAAKPFRGAPGWTWYIPADLGAGGAVPLPLRSSHVSLLARSRGYVIVGPDHHGVISTGEPVEIVPFSAGGRS
ncbi:MAG TPA: molybdopterin molybdotransferase MoeA [Candidatus Lustribacter sp.]